MINNATVRFVAGSLAISFVAAAIGYGIGIFRGIEIHAVQESKLAEFALRPDHEVQLCPQLREYLKGRLYWNSFAHMDRGHVLGLLKDYGPVNLNELGGVIYRKDPTGSDEEIRQSALLKMKQ